MHALRGRQRRAIRPVSLGALAMALLSVAACGGTTVVGIQSNGSAIEAAYHAPDVTVNPADKTMGVAPSTVITVNADNGDLQSVIVTAKGDTAPLPGTLAANRRTWTASSNLQPDATYTVVATALGAGGTATDAASTFSTSGGQHLITQTLPGDGATVGVGMPIKLKFNTDIPAALQYDLVRHIQIQSTPRIQGDWHWFSGNEVHWRPAAYWPSGTHVTIDAQLQGVNAGNGIWGYGNWTSSFTVGPKHISLIDHNTETMLMYENDLLIRTVPVSLGKAGFPTISGNLVVWYKNQTVKMDSCASGITCNHSSPNYYDENVYWDTAVSTDGFFIHAAPWDIFAQGHYDYSHGCINVSTDNAVFFFNWAQVGDIVTISNTARQADAGDGQGDWQIPADQYANSGGMPPTQTPGTQGGGV